MKNKKSKKTTDKSNKGKLPVICADNSEINMNWIKFARKQRLKEKKKHK
ncbi:hypothetical protein [Desulfurobacterium sp.]